MRKLIFYHGFRKSYIAGMRTTISNEYWYGLKISIDKNHGLNLILKRESTYIDKRLDLPDLYNNRLNYTCSLQIPFVSPEVS